MTSVIPDLTFPMMRYSSLHVPHDLRVFLYVGASSLTEREAHRQLSEGVLEDPSVERLELVEGLHDFLSCVVIGGRSERTFRAHYKSLKGFFAYVDVVGYQVNIYNVEGVFIAWANGVSQRLQRSEISKNTASYWVSKVAKSLEDILGITSTALLKKTRLGKTKSQDSNFSVSAKHKTFDETREFVSDLLDLIALLSQGEALSMLPLRLTTALSDKVDINRGGSGRNFTANKSSESELVLEIKEGNSKSERTFMNLRLLCELHYFIFYTGTNLEDAKKLDLANIKGWTEESGRRYRTYKERKGGSVNYKVYEKFVAHFEAFLEFRSQVVFRRPSSRLFPFIKDDNVNQSDVFHASSLRLLLQRLGRPYISPSAIRTYLLNDVFEYAESAKLAAGVGQHNVHTFVKSYMRPKLEVAATQWTQFFATVEEELNAIAPGRCSSSIPVKIVTLEHLGAEPNCSNSAGCLFCEQYRGVISFDYIWSLLSYRKVKNNEGFVDVGMASNSALSSVQAVLLRIDQIVEEFRGVSSAAEEFYLDALSRCADSDHHPKWAGYLEIMDLV